MGICICQDAKAWKPSIRLFLSLLKFWTERLVSICCLKSYSSVENYPVGIWYLWPEYSWVKHLFLLTHFFYVSSHNNHQHMGCVNVICIRRWKIKTSTIYILYAGYTLVSHFSHVPVNGIDWNVLLFCFTM